MKTPNITIHMNKTTAMGIITITKMVTNMATNMVMNMVTNMIMIMNMDTIMDTVKIRMVTANMRMAGTVTIITMTRTIIKSDRSHDCRLYYFSVWLTCLSIAFNMYINVLSK
uniref:Uncharacterized protein n=1 Tax=Photinus pyralis TaxID=7054 RepID=A0A1Y1MMD2_PHOPY